MLKEREKRNSSILSEIERQEMEEQSNQKWLESRISGPNNSLKRIGSNIFYAL